MTTSHANHFEYPPSGKPASLDELFRDVPVQTVADLACDGLFDTDEEVDELIAHIYVSRRADVA